MSGPRKFTSFIKSLSIPVSAKPSSASNSPKSCSPAEGSPRLAGRNRSDSLTKPRVFFTPGLDMLPDERKKRAEAAMPDFLTEINKDIFEYKTFLSEYYSAPLNAEAEAQLATDFFEFAENRMEDLLSIVATLNKLDDQSEEAKTSTLSNSPSIPRSSQKEEEPSNSPRVLRRHSIAPAQMPSIVMLFMDHVIQQVNKLKP